MTQSDDRFGANWPSVGLRVNRCSAYSSDVRWVLGSLVLAGCGRLHFDPHDDAAACPRPMLDFGPPPTQPFNAPVVVAELTSTGGEDDPTLTGDELEIYFQSTRGGSSRIWRSVRATKTAPWPTPEPVSELDGSPWNTPELSRDGLRMTLELNADIYITSRADRTSPWRSPVLVQELTTTSNESGAVEFLSGTGIALASDRPGGNSLGDVWETFRDPVDCTLTTARVAAGVAPTTNVWMRDDGLVLVFPGPGATGAGDLGFATRASLDGSFGPYVELTTLNSGGVDDDPWLDDAMTSIYFMSARTGQVLIYHATR